MNPEDEIARLAVTLGNAAPPGGMQRWNLQAPVQRSWTSRLRPARLVATLGAPLTTLLTVTTIAAAGVGFFAIHGHGGTSTLPPATVPGVHAPHTNSPAVSAPPASGNPTAAPTATPQPTSKSAPNNPAPVSNPTPTSCFATPGACGYPDPAYHNVGVSNCSALPAFSFANRPAGTYYSGTGNGLEIVSSNVNISNMNLGNISIYVAKGANNFTLNNVCMSVDGGGSNGSMAINIAAGVTGTTVENSTLGGMNNTTQSLGVIVNNQGANTVIKNDYTYNSGGGAPGAGSGSADVENNYESINATVTGSGYSTISCSDNTLTINHNTLLNMHGGTSVIFCNTGGGSGGACDNHLTVTSNLIAGGGWMLYPCGNASSVGSSTTNIQNNRFARSAGATADSHGYWPKGGYYGVAAYSFSGPGQTWSGNYWDDNLQPAG